MQTDIKGEYNDRFTDFVCIVYNDIYYDLGYNYGPVPYDRSDGGKSAVSGHIPFNEFGFYHKGERSSRFLQNKAQARACHNAFRICFHRYDSYNNGKLFRNAR